MFAFGRGVPEEIVKERGVPVRWWGARAIFKNGIIDLLPDRQSCECQYSLDPQPLLDWLNQKALPELKQRKDFKNLHGDSREVLEVKERGFTLQVCPNASYGYLYMGAWQYWPKGAKYEQKEPDPTAKWSSKNLPVPPLNAEVVINCNGEWRGKVSGYFVEAGSAESYQGVEVDCTVIPQWKKDEFKRNRHPLVLPYRGLFFGLELKEVKA